MTNIELKSIRISMGLDIKHMALKIGRPYRTYQDWELGNRGIPDKTVPVILAAQEKERGTVDRIKNLIVADIDGRLIK